MSAGFDPLYKWLGIPPDEQPPHCYRLLGLRAFEDNADAIESAADRQMAYLKTFQSGPHVQIAQELLNQVATAKVWLLNPEKKTEYDAWLREQLGPVAPPVPPPGVPQAATQDTVPDLSDVLGDVDAYGTASERIKRRHSRQWLATGVALALAILVLAGIGSAVWRLQVGLPALENAASVSVPPSSPGPSDYKVDEKRVEKVEATTVQAKAVLPKTIRKGLKAGTSATREPESKKEGAGKPEAEPADEELKSDNSSMEDAAEAKKLPGQNAVDAKLAPPTRSEKGADQAQRSDVPSDPDLRKARQTIQEVYKVGGARSATDKQALAKRLLQEATQTQNDPVGQFALLQSTQELAVECGDGLTAFSAVEEMAQRYKVDSVDLKSQILDTFAKKAKLPEQHKSVANETLRLIDAATAEGRFPLASQLGKLAVREAAKARDKETLQRTRARVKELEEVAAAYEEVKAAVAVLAERPQDAEANLAAGKYHCFFRGDWVAGLPMLARGSDAGLKALARRDLEGASAAEAQVELAEQWKDLAMKSSGLIRRQQQSRAAYWYRKALPGLTGLAKAAAERWLKESGAAATEGEDR